MSAELFRILRDSMTDETNVTWDMFRILAVASIAVGFTLEAWSVWHGKEFSMQEFGIGIGALLGGVGVSLRLNKDTPIESRTTEYSRESTSINTGATKEEVK